jgi:membrane protease subunit (stomatin/prohibitin family)
VRKNRAADRTDVESGHCGQAQPVVAATITITIKGPADMGFLNEARREFIAAPDSSKGQIVYKWPDQNIRKFARAIVEPDALAVFMNQGRLAGVLAPGQHVLDASELPFLGMFVDWATNSDAFRAELYFVGNREYPQCRFGGRLDEVQDPQSGLIVTLRMFGEYALRVTDPTRLILNLVGTVDVTNNEAITAWVAQQLLKVTRTAVTKQLMSGEWAILGLSVHTPEIEAAALRDSNEHLAGYGLAIARFGNVDINLDDDDNARLRKLAGDTAYSRLAGGFLQAAQAEALQGAGEGMAKGGGAVGPMFVGAGLGMAGQMMPPPQQAPPAPPPPGPGFAGGGPGFVQAPTPPPAQAQEATAPAAPATVECPECHSQVRAGAKFCDNCGKAMAGHCANCDAELSATAKFCPECGTSVTPPSA